MGGAFVVELIDTFGEDARELIGTLRRALAATDIDAFRRAAHSLKSTSESLGAGAPGDPGARARNHGPRGEPAGSRPRLEQLAEAYEIVAHRLEELRRDLSA